MAQNLEDMLARMNKCKTECVYSQRRWEEAAQVAVKALSGMKDEHVERLLDVVPNLKIIRTYTVEQINENKNGELKLVQETLQALLKFAEDGISFLEAQL